MAIDKKKTPHYMISLSTDYRATTIKANSICNFLRGGGGIPSLAPARKSPAKATFRFGRIISANCSEWGGVKGCHSIQGP